MLRQLNGPFPEISLYVLENNKDIINGFHIATVVKNYWKSYKKVSSNPANNESSFIEQDSFKKLCALINSNLDKLSISEAAQIYEYLEKMQVDTALVTQPILEHINNSIDNLSIEEFNLVFNILKRMAPTPSMIKIKNNLLNKFIRKITSDFQENNIDHISHAFSFISSNYPKSGQRQLLEIVFEKLDNYQESISPKNSVMILEALCSMKWHPENWINVLQKVQNEMILKADEYKSAQILHVLQVIGEKLFAESRYSQLFSNIYCQIFQNLLYY